jgi:uncharacterized protein YqeY
MSKLLEQIKADQLKARKTRNLLKAKLLTTLIGEASPSGNGAIDDNAVKATITKFVKNIGITLRIKPNQDSEDELAILKAYLPEDLKGDALASYVGRQIEKVHATSMRDMGKVMGKLKSAPYTIDMGKAQSIIKQLLK